MEITEIRLTDYRNYAEQSIGIMPGINVLIGDNAQGKTNVLESIRLCSIGRSHRTSRDKELIRDEADRAIVMLDWRRRDGSHELQALLPSNAAKQVRIDGKLLKRSGELMGQLATVLFAPEDLTLVKSGPAERRRFIDMELSQLRPRYYYSLQRYNRALKQRNNLLRALEEHPEQHDTLDSWDAILIEEGAQLIRLRTEFVSRIDEYAGRHHAHITDGAERLNCRYVTCVSTDGQLSEQLARGFVHARSRDLAARTTTFGPHRDDMALELNGRDARIYGSQGQQRTIALSLKLSELTLVRDETGEWPVLLLDDVMSELDPARRRLLLDCIGEVQTIVTCTDKSDLAGANIEQALYVRSGTITSEPVK